MQEQNTSKSTNILTEDDTQKLKDALIILVRTIVNTITMEIAGQIESRYNAKENSLKLLSDVIAVECLEQPLALSIVEASKLLGLSRASTYEAASTGQIPSIRVRKRIIVPRAALLKILSQAS
jgi:excisionase family DNA binding protein